MTNGIGLQHPGTDGIFADHKSARHMAVDSNKMSSNSWNNPYLCYAWYATSLKYKWAHLKAAVFWLLEKAVVSF